ncbi:ABC transporter ATP-binding protein [Jiangella gansuensis]|uniref:ABC transporter ATP-binding protein n=1 Tax=Jiangella gansuensis TaxID=281473 RepID=UPI00047A680A|nr:ABC transporter ATP-binding protein [Jiangella gansuensis]
MRVVFDDLTVALGGTDVVRSVSMAVEDGRFVGLLGPNGSGKSTLLRTLYRAVTPRAGRALLNEDDVRRLRPRDVARAVAVMLQETSAEFDLTVLEVVLLGRVPHRSSFGRDTAQDLRIAEEALVRVGALELADRMVGQLSGGQKQRVMLARALAQAGPVLVLDEPTNHLDIAHQLELMRIVGSLDRTVIAALHDLNLAAAHCDEVAVLKDGRLVAYGPPRDVLTRELVRQVFDVDARFLPDPETGRTVLAFGHPQAPSASTVIRPEPEGATTP